MEKKYAEIFINSWNAVIESFSVKHIVNTYMQGPADRLNSREICVLIEITGDVSGQIFMSMDAETGKVLASEMLGGLEITEVDELVLSAVSELCNMIMGNACAGIGSADVDITPPAVVSDREIQPEIKPFYNISFFLDNAEIIDFHVAVMGA